MTRLSSFLAALLLLSGCSTPEPEVPAVGPEVTRYTLTCSVKTLKGRNSLPADIANIDIYDLQFLKTVEARWLDLLAQWRYTGLRTGKVIVRFHLHSDGRITSLERLNNQVGETQGLACQKAILDPAPYARRPQGSAASEPPDPRELLLTFSYQ